MPCVSACSPSSLWGFSLPSFGLAPAAPLQVHAPLSPTQTVEISLPLSTAGSVMKTEPLNNLQVRPQGDQAPRSFPHAPGRAGKPSGPGWLCHRAVSVESCSWTQTGGDGKAAGGEGTDTASREAVSGDLLSCAHREQRLLGASMGIRHRGRPGPPCSQVAVKNNIDVFYFSTLYPLHILFVEDGKMGES